MRRLKLIRRIEANQEDDHVLAIVDEVFFCLSQVEPASIAKADVNKMKGVIHRHIKRTAAVKTQKKQAIKQAQHWRGAYETQMSKNKELQDQCDKLLADNNAYKIMHERLGVLTSRTPLLQDCHDECSGGQAGQSSGSGGQQQVGKALAGSQHGPSDSQLLKPMPPSHAPPSYLMSVKPHRNSEGLGTKERPIGQSTWS